MSLAALSYESCWYNTCLIVKHLHMDHPSCNRPPSSPPWFEVHERCAERWSSLQHESRKVSVERAKFVQWRNGANVSIRVYDDERTSSAADTISFANPKTIHAIEPKACWRIAKAQRRRKGTFSADQQHLWIHGKCTFSTLNRILSNLNKPSCGALGLRPRDVL